MVGLRRWHGRRAWANEPFAAGVNNCVNQDLQAVRAGGGFGSQEGAKAARCGGPELGCGVGSVSGTDRAG